MLWSLDNAYVENNVRWEVMYRKEVLSLHCCSFYSHCRHGPCGFGLVSLLCLLSACVLWKKPPKTLHFRAKCLQKIEFFIWHSMRWLVAECCSWSHCPCPSMVPTPTPEVTTHHWAPPGHWGTDHNSLSGPTQLIPYPPSGPSIRLMSLQLRDKDMVWDSVKHFTQFQADGFSCSSLTHHLCNSTVGCHKVCQAWFSCSEALVAVTNHIPTFHVPYKNFQEILLHDFGGHRDDTLFSKWGLYSPFSSQWELQEAAMTY